jgi:hypothetical protein
MGKIVGDNAMDASFYYIKGTNLDAARDETIVMYVCSGTPTDRASVLTNALASVILLDTDFTFSDGIADGRRMIIAEQTDVPVSVNGTASHIALIDTTQLLLQTIVPATPIFASGTITIAAFSHVMRDPT